MPLNFNVFTCRRDTRVLPISFSNRTERNSLMLQGFRVSLCNLDGTSIILPHYKNNMLMYQCIILVFLYIFCNICRTVSSTPDIQVTLLTTSLCCKHVETTTDIKSFCSYQLLTWSSVRFVCAAICFFSSSVGYGC